MERRSPKDQIIFRSMAPSCRIGVLPGEADGPQPLEIRLAVDVDLDAAARSDALADTLDYRDLAAAVESACGQRYGLLEALAGQILTNVLEDPRVKAASVEVTKARAPLGERVGPISIRLYRGQEANS